MGEQTQRFTLDGNADLEARLQDICAEVLEHVSTIVPAANLEGLVLGGGYGRGEGGVLKTASREMPYNDLEFYVFIGGNRLLQERKYGHQLLHLAESLSETHHLHIEFKIESLRRLRTSPTSMFSYDLVSRHRILHGKATLFAGCERHLCSEAIPNAEASRLLLNRFTGLLLVKEILAGGWVKPEEADFSRRNLAKAQLALGDAVLAHVGRYHWSCLERRRRLEALEESFPRILEIRTHHASGAEFKFHPYQSCETWGELATAHKKIGSLALDLWLSLESRRLCRGFSTAREYAFSPLQKWPATPAWRNWLLTLRTFGAKALFASGSLQYPRERLFNALPLLLWDVGCEPRALGRLQQQLHTGAADWFGLVGAYKRVWSSYG
jgi:hypothetical protein